MSNNKEDFDAQVSAFKEKYPDFDAKKYIDQQQAKEGR